MFGSLTHIIKDGMMLTPMEKAEYMALKLILYPYALSDSEKQKVFDKEGKLHNNDVIRCYLLYKHKLGRFKPEYEKAQRELNCIDLSKRINVLDYLLKRMGSSIKKILDTKDKVGFHIIDKTMTFKETRLNYIGKYPIYLDLEGYLHICLRHIREWKINDFWSKKTEFQLMEDDLMPTLRKAIEEINEKFQLLKDKDENLVYRKYGRESIYLNGDYYSLEIDKVGRVVNFNKVMYSEKFS